MEHRPPDLGLLIAGSPLRRNQLPGVEGKATRLLQVLDVPGAAVPLHDAFLPHNSSRCCVKTSAEDTAVVTSLSGTDRGKMTR